MFTRLLIKLEKKIFFCTGLILPTLRDKWHRDAIDIQYQLDHQNK